MKKIILLTALILLMGEPVSANVIYTSIPSTYLAKLTRLVQVRKARSACIVLANYRLETEFNAGPNFFPQIDTSCQRGEPKPECPSIVPQWHLISEEEGNAHLQAVDRTIAENEAHLYACINFIGSF